MQLLMERKLTPPGNRAIAPLLLGALVIAAQRPRTRWRAGLRVALWPKSGAEKTHGVDVKVRHRSDDESPSPALP